MAYQTGTVSGSAALATLIQNFAVANGWALSAGSLSKGPCHVKVEALSTSELSIQGARNGLYSAPDICPRRARIFLTVWPANVTYHIVAFAAPDTVWCTINFNGTDYMHIGFGNMEKYGGWEGGGWFHGQHTTGNSDGDCIAHIDGQARPYYSNSPNNCAPFWNQQDYSPWGTNSNNKCSFIQCELRGEVWPACGAVNDTSDLNQIHCPKVLTPTHKNNPNAFNGQTVLTPYQLFLQNTDGHYMSVGHVDHIRFVKLTNYNPGDIIDIGADRWIVFPMHRKDPTKPDGVSHSNLGTSTGFLGIAVRYDGA